MILIDTSVWVQVLRDKQGKWTQAFRERTDNDVYVLTRFTQLELLQGAGNEREWKLLDEYLSTQYYLESSENTFRDAARIFFDLRRKGITVLSAIDCCIAQLAIEAEVLLLHKDRDFEKIARVRPLRHEFFDL